MIDKFDIIISYSRVDLVRVKTIKAEFERSTCALCWMDLDGIESGPGGDIIISVSQDNTIKLWNPIYGYLLYTLNGYTGKIASANFSRNGKWIVLTSSDKTIKVWDVQSGCLLNTIECRYVRYNSFFSLDDKSIISLCANKMEIYGFPPLKQLIDETRERFNNRKLTPDELRKYYLENI